METEKKYKVVKIYRKSTRRILLAKDLTREAAMEMVKSFPNNKNSIVCFYQQGGAE